MEAVAGHRPETRAMVRSWAKRRRATPASSSWPARNFADRQEHPERDLRLHCCRRRMAPLRGTARTVSARTALAWQADEDLPAVRDPPLAPARHRANPARVPE